MSTGTSYIWGILSRFVPQCLYLITTMILARILSVKDFGIMGVLAIIFTVANILLDSGLGGSLIHKKEISSLDCSTIGVFNVVVAFAIYVVLFLCGGLLEDYFAIDGLENVVRTIGLVFPITAIGVVPSALLKRSLQFKQIFYSTFAGVIVASICSIAIAVAGGGVYALVAYQIIVNAVTVVLNSYFSHYLFIPKFCFANLKELFPFGFFTSVVTIVDTIYENLMTTLTGKYLSMKNAGYIFQAKRLEETVSSSLAIALGIVIFPILTRIRDDKSAFIKESKETFRVITLIVFPILMTVSVFSKEIIWVIFGNEFLPAYKYLSILMFCGIFILMEQIIYSFIKSYGSVEKIMFYTFGKRGIGIMLLVSAILTNPNMLIYCYLISTVIGFTINAFVYSKMLKVSVLNFGWHATYCLIPSIIFFAILYIAHLFVSNIFICILICVALLVFYYFVFLRLLGINIANYAKLLYTNKENK